MCNNILVLRWKKAKLIYNELDTLFNTGLLKFMLFECFIMLIWPYSFLEGIYYIEESNSSSKGIKFAINDLLICLGLFFRVHIFIRSALNLSSYKDPRAQRVCDLYGSEASNTFALRSLMKEQPMNILTTMLMFSLVLLSY